MVSEAVEDCPDIKVNGKILIVDDENVVRESLGKWFSSEGYQTQPVSSAREALESIAGLRPAVDRFFDEVLVMAEAATVRKNRLGLLSSLLKEFSTIANFSEIAAEERR